MSSDPSDDDTLKNLVPPVPTDAPWPETGSAQVEVDLAAVSDRGLVRANNEDQCLVVRFRREMETLLTNLPPDSIPARAEEVGYGLVVADGMGGTGGGEVASQLAVTTLISLALHTPDWIFGLSP